MENILVFICTWTNKQSVFQILVPNQVKIWINSIMKMISYFQSNVSIICQRHTNIYKALNPFPFCWKWYTVIMSNFTKTDMNCTFTHILQYTLNHVQVYNKLYHYYKVYSSRGHKYWHPARTYINRDRNGLSL